MRKRNVKLIFMDFLAILNKQLRINDERTPLQTCGNCIQAFRKKRKHDVVVCLPYLKTMPADNKLVCDLYLRDDRQH